MLEMRQAGINGIRGTHPSQTSKRKVIVKDKCLLWIMEALYVLSRFCIIGTSVYMLHHVKILRNVFEVLVLVGVQHFVHEVNIPEVPRGSGLILDLERGLDDLLHHVGPVAVLDGRDHLVNVQQGDVVVSRIENNKPSLAVTPGESVVYFMPLLWC